MLGRSPPLYCTVYFYWSPCSVFSSHLFWTSGLLDVPAGVTQEEGSHRISHPPSFCGACLNFSCEKNSAIPFPRRPWSRILCTNDFDRSLLDLLGIFIFIFILFFIFSEEKPQLPEFELTSQRVRRFQGYQLSHRGDRRTPNKSKNKTETIYETRFKEKSERI